MRRSFLMLALLPLAAVAAAQTTQRPIEIIVPFAPGASADGIARLVGNDLATRLARNVVIESKAGAGGTLGLQLLAKATPDGNTLAIGAPGALVIAPNLPGATFQPLHALAPVARLIDIPIVVVANPAGGPKTIAEMLARTSLAPDIPTIAEAGVPGYASAPGFLGLFAPAGTPEPAIKKITHAVAAYLETPEAHAKVRGLAAEVVYQDDVAFAQFLAEQSARWKNLLAGLSAAK